MQFLKVEATYTGGNPLFQPLYSAQIESTTDHLVWNKHVHLRIPRQLIL